MTSEEIKNAATLTGSANTYAELGVAWWLKEIAYQLAVVNEVNAAADQRERDRRAEEVWEARRQKGW